MERLLTRDAWRLGPGQVIPFFLTKSLIVRHTEEGHQQVSEWLRQRRERLDTRNR